MRYNHEKAIRYLWEDIMKVGIIAANQIRYSPYIFFYTGILDWAGFTYELIVPQRGTTAETYEGILHTLPWDHALPTSLAYAKYAREVIRLIKQKHYDALIVLTAPNAAYLSLWLKRYYTKRYIVDIRDYSHENILPYYLLEKVALRYSLVNVISSPGFRAFLPEGEYHVCHNFSLRDYTEVHASFQRSSDPIVIGYVGALAYVDQCKRLMTLVDKDDRFRMSFYGTSDSEEELKAFAKTLDGSHITFHGGYVNTQKPDIIQKCDILFNAYGNGCPLLDHALSNKLYDALIFRKPILTCPGTAMTNMGGILAYPIDLASAANLDALFEWYKQLDAFQVDNYAQTTMDSCVAEHLATMELIKDTLSHLA